MTADTMTAAADAPDTHRTAASTAHADWLRALRRTAGIAPTGTRTLARIVDEWAAATPDQPALVGEDEALTYRDLAALSLRCAGWALAQGLQPGDRVAVLMNNAPSYVAVWLGLSRVGVVSALLNARLVGAGLRHCLDAAGARHLVTDVEVGCAGAMRVWQPATLAAAEAADAAALARRAPVLRAPALLRAAH